MKPFKGKRANHGRFEEQSDHESSRAKRPRRVLNEDDEIEFQSWMNRPSDVSDYLDDDQEDLHPSPRKA